MLSAAATFANMYVVLTTYYHNNPQISDWLGTGDMFASAWGVAIASITQALILGWAFFQLRRSAVERIAEDVALAGHDPGEQSHLADRRPAPRPPTTEADLRSGASLGAGRRRLATARRMAGLGAAGDADGPPGNRGGERHARLGP